MKKIICFISMFAIMACAFSQNYYNNGTTTTRNREQKEQKDPKDQKHHREDHYNELEARRVVFGVTFGPTLNWMNWKNHKAAPEGYERPARGSVKLGLRYGVNLDIDLTKSKNYYVSTGVLIEHTGGNLAFFEKLNLTGETIFRDIERRYKSIYFTIPTAITLRTPSFSHFIICGNIGLYHSFNLYSRYQSRFQIDPAAIDTDKETINYVTTDWAKDNEVALFKESIFAGLGFEYVIKRHLKGKLYVNYAQSLNNYFSKNAKNSQTGVSEKASIGTVEILLGLSF